MKKRLPWNWRNNIETVKDLDNFDENLITFQLQFMNDKTPKGFYKTIGFLTIEVPPTSGNFPLVMESYIHEPMRNRGLGKLLYITALDNFKSLSTKYHDHSDCARNVWLSLMKEFKYTTDFLSGILTIHE